MAAANLCPLGTLVILFILPCSLLLVMPNSTTIARAAAPEVLRQLCPDGPDTAKYTAGSQFDRNLDRLLRSLHNNGKDSIFSNDTQGHGPDKVYGLYLCRGDVAPKDCRNCIDMASKEIVKQCRFKKEAIIWYDQCLIRYANRSFFSTVEPSPRFVRYTAYNMINPENFSVIFDGVFHNLTNLATSNPPNYTNYASSETGITTVETLYSMVQCTPDLSPPDCRNCLSDAMKAIKISALKVSRGGRVFSRSCNLRYETLPFLEGPQLGHSPPTIPTADGSNGAFSLSLCLMHQ